MNGKYENRLANLTYNEVATDKGLMSQEMKQEDETLWDFINANNKLVAIIVVTCASLPLFFVTGLVIFYNLYYTQNQECLAAT